MDYGFPHDGRVFTPNGTPGITPAENDDRNRAIELAELEHWKTSPDRFLAYFDFPQEPRGGVRLTGFYPVRTDAIVTTWPGTTIGSIVRARVYTTSLGGRVLAITVRGTNGAMYYGRASWDNGSAIVLRRTYRGRK